jgi:hypothetical protein
VSTPEAVAADLNRREVAASKAEQDVRVSQERRIIADRLSSNSAIEPTEKNKQAVEDLILANTTSENFFESSEMFDPRSRAALILNQSVMSGVLPKTLDTALTNLANGGIPASEEAAKNLLTFYSQMSNQPRGGSIVNAFNVNNALGEKTIAKLEAITQIHLATGEGINAIATKMSADALDQSLATVRSQQFAEAVDSDSPQISTKQFVAAAVPEAAMNVQALNAMAPLANYMFGAFDAGTIADKLNNYYERVFVETEGYIIDSASRSGERSRFALQAILPNDNVRDKFIEKVNNELGPSSFSISNQDRQNRAFLMPMFVSNGGVTFMAVRKEGMSLVPIPNETMGGLPYAFSTSEPDMVEYAKSQNAKTLMGDMTIEEIQEIRSERAGKQSLISLDTPRSFFTGGGFMSGGFR